MCSRPVCEEGMGIGTGPTVAAALGLVRHSRLAGLGTGLNLERL